MRISGWLFLTEQFLCSLCLLWAMGKSAGLTRMSLPRLLISAALVSSMCLSGMTLPALWRVLLLAAAMSLAPLLAWPGVPARLRLRLLALGGFLSVWMAGLLRLGAGLSLPSMAALTAGCGLLTASPGLVRRASCVPSCATLDIRCGRDRLTLTALVDTGNLLRDAVTGLPVTIISRRAAARLLTLPPPGSILPGMRLISIRTVTGTALMTVFRPDRVRIRQGNAWLDVHTLIGLAPDGYEGFQALMPACLSPASSLPNRPIISQGG